MEQPNLFDAPVVDDTEARIEASHRAFVLDVAAGKYDRYGYTPADRRALERRNKERAAEGLPPRVPGIELVTVEEVLAAQQQENR